MVSPWLPLPFRFWPLVKYLAYFYHPFSAESLWVRAYSWSVWEDGLCKIHSIKCSKIVFLPQMPNIIFSQTFYKICCLQHICCVRPQSTVKEVERDLSSYNLYLLKKVVWCDAWHQRSEKLFPLQSRAPCPPFSGWNNPLCKFLCSTVTSTITFLPSTFTFRTFVWNRGTWNLPPTTPSSCLPL